MLSELINSGCEFLLFFYFRREKVGLKLEQIIKLDILFSSRFGDAFPSLLNFGKKFRSQSLFIFGLRDKISDNKDDVFGFLGAE
jgi:hypothetical protein